MMSTPRSICRRTTSSGVRNIRAAVDVRAELDARIRDLAQRREAEDLIAAAVGEDRPVPAHEAVQAAELADELRARPQGQVVGVGEDDLCADLA